jgi:hypothetical protein
MTSLAKMRALSDLDLRPAHGPTGSSTHGRVDELMIFHEDRLAQCLKAAQVPTTAFGVAQQLRWTRRERRLSELDTFNQGMAIRKPDPTCNS